MFCLRHSAKPEYKRENSYPNRTHVSCPDTFFVPFYDSMAKPSFFHITDANAFSKGTCTDVCLVFSFNRKHLNMMLLDYVQVHVYSLCLLHNVILVFNFLIISGLCYQIINYKHVVIAFAVIITVLQMIHKIHKKQTNTPQTFNINSPTRHSRNTNKYPQINSLNHSGSPYIIFHKF